MAGIRGGVEKREREGWMRGREVAGAGAGGEQALPMRRRRVPRAGAGFYDSVTRGRRRRV